MFPLTRKSGRSNLFLFPDKRIQNPSLFDLPEKSGLQKPDFSDKVYTAATGRKEELLC